jgi:hypothetical protein
LCGSAGTRTKTDCADTRARADADASRQPRHAEPLERCAFQEIASIHGPSARLAPGTHHEHDTAPLRAENGLAKRRRLL